MSNRATHMLVGGVGGAAVAGILSCDTPWDQMFPEILGGAFGGLVGGCLPDILDPPDSPNHRAVAHSIAGGVGVGYLLTKPASRIHELRAAACRVEAQAQAIRLYDSSRALRLDIFAFVLRMAAGFTSGLGAGYLSHLALDSGTPKGLPVIGL